MAPRKLHKKLGGGKIAKPGRVDFHLKKVISSWIGTHMKASVGLKGDIFAEMCDLLGWFEFPPIYLGGYKRRATSSSRRREMGSIALARSSESLFPLRPSSTIMLVRIDGTHGLSRIWEYPFHGMKFGRKGDGSIVLKN